MAQSPAAGKRYSLYRKSTAGSNTLTFNNDRDLHPGWSAQNVNGVSAITVVKSTYGVVDLTEAYAVQYGPPASRPTHPAKRVERGFAFDATFTKLFVVDEIDFDGVDNVTWAMHSPSRALTFAAGTDGASAVLTHAGGASLQLNVRILYPDAPDDATMAWVVPHAAPPQDPIEGIAKLVVKVQAAHMGRIVIALSPSPIAKDTPLPRPLAEWASFGPF